jgi:hypothetical protein
MALRAKLLAKLKRNSLELCPQQHSQRRTLSLEYLRPVSVGVSGEMTAGARTEGPWSYSPFQQQPPGALTIRQSVAIFGAVPVGRVQARRPLELGSPPFPVSRGSPQTLR